ncbi:succinate dehydrogenase/fumarate reductase iron-sulfur subunit [Gimesia panareensis]|uniref:succinate dehydrogenase/fumarate reductase iron-sulfur subunit n=1 Tax=Gimesia panareensis TaxID=2527978 RepID=UPI001189E1B6|nr:succinate dehydrogenase/fumarate reductase iron-sulfur subunit [Gimesia panareensis]QDU48938.1 Fumarate reductase iron-sulfur subunit [Gimesia panareensis]
MSETLDLTLRIWRQPGPDAVGRYVEYKVTDISTHMSFLEMLDVLNQQLVEQGEEMIAFDHDCREGICGMCSLMINGQAHGPDTGTTTCQLHMRRFKSGDTIVIEPWRSQAFPVVRDLVVDRSAFDRIIEQGGYISVSTGNAPDANTTPVPLPVQETAMDAAACIGCGACVAACKNASAMLFVSAKVSHLSVLPQGAPERASRVQKMVAQMDAEGFGNCTNTEECQAACPAEISVSNIARLNREYLRAQLCSKD